MVSGHRRKAAYAMLAEGDPEFERLPCRVVDGMSDEDALVLLHTANYFTRELNVIERAEASRALGAGVAELRNRTRRSRACAQRTSRSPSSPRTRAGR